MYIKLTVQQCNYIAYFQGVNKKMKVQAYS